MLFTMVMRSLRSVGVATVCCVFQFASAQELHQEHVVPKSNLELMQQAIQQITNEMLESAQRVNTGDSISVKVQAQAESWIVEQAVAKELKAHQVVVYSSRDSISSTKYVLHVRSMQLSVRYDNMFKDGIFGSKHVEREVSVQLSSDLRNQATNEILAGGTHSRLYSDTVAVEDVGSIENESMNVTRGELPSEAFVDRFIEPFVIIGATGVAVYLLFHIRSQ